MEFKLTDGKGTSNAAKVFEDGRVSTKSITITEQQRAAANGDAYQIGTGMVSFISGGSDSAVLLITNDSQENLGFSAVNITSPSYVGTSETACVASIYLGATAISSSTTKQALNNNFGSSKTLGVTIEAGQEGSTLTGGTKVGEFFIPVGTFFNTDIAWVLPKGQTLALTIFPAAGNTDWACTVTLEAVVFGDI